MRVLLLKNKIIQNASWIMFGKVVQALIAFVINMLTARYLGPSNYGVIAYAASIVSFVVPIMNLGFSNVLVQEQIEHPEETGEIYGTSIVLSLVSSLSCILGVSVYTFLVDAGQIETNIVVILYSTMLFFQAMELIQYWFQAKLLAKYMAIVSFLAYFIVAVYKVVLLIKGASVEYFAVTNAFDYFLIAIALFLIYKKLGGPKLSFSKNNAQRLFSNSKHYIISSLMVSIFAQTDRIMLKLMRGEAAVGFYSAAVTCASITNFVFVALIDSFRPTIFNHKKNNDIEGYEDRIIWLYSIVIYLALAQSFCMTVFAKFIIGLLYGVDYAPAITALQIVVWYTTFSYMGSVRNVWVLGEHKQKYLWILNLGGAVTNILLNILLIPMWGINGAALASLITQAFTNVIMNIVVWPLRYNNKLIVRALNPTVFLRLIKRGGINE